MKNIRYIFITFLILFGMYVFWQKPNFENPDSQDMSQDTLFINGYGEFENYAFILDGKIIERNTLADYSEAWLDQLSPREAILGGRTYNGILHFKTSGHPNLATTHAYFINGRQVTFYDVRRLKPEMYTRIEKSEQNIVIDRISYKGSILVETEEDFFARHISLSEFLLDRYPDLSSDHTLIQLEYRSYSPTGIVYDNRHLYHIDLRHLLPVKAGRIRLSPGVRNVVRLVDTSYLLSAEKVRLIFDNPSQLDGTCPCCLADNYTKRQSNHAYIGPAEINPVPFQGTDSYLKRLSETLVLPGRKGVVPSMTDSVGVEFIVTRTGMLKGFKTIRPGAPDHERILQAIKRHSCEWSTAMYSGRAVNFRRQMTIYYTVDQKGDIVSLDDLKFRYDP